MTTTTRTADGDHLEISYRPGSYTTQPAIRIESLDRNGTPNWGLTLTTEDASELADILADYAKDAFAAGIKGDADAREAAKDEAHLDPANKPASDPFAGIVDVKTNDPWDAS